MADALKTLRADLAAHLSDVVLAANLRLGLASAPALRPTARLVRSGRYTSHEQHRWTCQAHERARSSRWTPSRAVAQVGLREHTSRHHDGRRFV
jgi:hypothetical protein